MNNNIFDNKVAEILDNNKEHLPKMKNKEQMWTNIEQSLTNSKKTNRSFYYIIPSAAACIIAIIGAFTLFNKKEQPFLAKIQEKNYNVHEQTIITTNKEPEFTVIEKPKYVLNKETYNKIATTKILKEDSLPVENKQLITVNEHNPTDLITKKEEEKRVEKEDITIKVSISSKLKKEDITIRTFKLFPYNTDSYYASTSDAKSYNWNKIKIKID